ncbi:uncharacterized protein [Palaemon carinicauda]|uniref:uncharacterized protein n=1 Tax=Palaemon carinicauda TaxID=392227 RepID=UPI0035B65A29
MDELCSTNFASGDIRRDLTRAKDIGNSLKLLYSSPDVTGKSDATIFIVKEMKENIEGVKKESEEIMEVMLCFGGHILNVVSDNAPQTECTADAKNKFWRNIDKVIIPIKTEERLVVGVDLNGHIGCKQGKHHGGHGMGE